MENTQDFKPYIPASKVIPEFTFTSIFSGILLAIVFGAANAYLGLRVGMTISASIPAAVIGMGITRIILKKNSILESNMVQTIGSAGESLAAGAIFTIPALFLWAKEGLIASPSLLSIMLITLCGGILGALFMIPLRNSIIVQEHGVLPYPEAQACAEVLLAGESKDSGAKAVFSGMGIAALFKFIVDGIKLVPGAIAVPINKLKTEFSTEIYPAVIGVGYICGYKISSYLFAGGVLAWFIIIPAIILFGGNAVMFPSAGETIGEIYAVGGAGAIWSKYVRYIGAGALVAAGLISLIKTLPLIFRTFASALKGLSGSKNSSTERTAQDLSIKVVIFGVTAVVLAIWLLPAIQAGIVSAILIVIFGFFFATVSSKMVGLVGASNNPVSGMTIATLLISTILLKVTGDTGAHGMISAITIASIICIIAAMAGDMSQDLKTGFLLGATPKKQQIGEIIGAIVSALTIGVVLVLLNNAWGFGSKELSAPQATLMKLVTEGVMNGNLPWNYVFIGVAITVVFEILGLPSLAVAIGVYLPLELSTAIMIGGVLRYIVEKKNKAETSENSSGVLFSSGMIAGEGLCGIILAVLTVCGVGEKIDLSRFIPPVVQIIGAVVLLAGLIALILRYALKKNESKV